jgi:hypothetical protein
MNDGLREEYSYDPESSFASRRHEATRRWIVMVDP